MFHCTINPFEHLHAQGGYKGSSFQDVTVEISIRDVTEDPTLCGTMSTDPCPDMDLKVAYYNFQ